VSYILYVHGKTRETYTRIHPYTQYRWTGSWKIVSRGDEHTMFLERQTWFGLYKEWVTEYLFEWVEEAKTTEIIYECN